MSRRVGPMAIVGGAAFIAGIVVFLVMGRNASSLLSWCVGPLLWFVGGVLVVGSFLNGWLRAAPGPRLVRQHRVQATVRKIA